MFCNLAIASVIHKAWFTKKTYARRPHTKKYSDNITSVVVILATVAIRYALDNWSSGVYLKQNFEGGTFKGKSIHVSQCQGQFVRSVCQSECRAGVSESVCQSRCQSRYVRVNMSESLCQSRYGRVNMSESMCQSQCVRVNVSESMCRSQCQSGELIVR